MVKRFKNLGLVEQSWEKSLVNNSLKFTSSDTQIRLNFLLKKMWEAFAKQKLLTFFQQKYQNIVYWIC